MKTKFLLLFFITLAISGIVLGETLNKGIRIETLTTAGTTYINISNLIPAEYNIEIDLESMLLYGTFVIQK